jgi:transposase, IS5 family
LNRILATPKEALSGISCSFTHHLRRAKYRNLEIINVKNADDREKPYKDLIEITENTIGYGAKGLKALTSHTVASLKDHALTAILTQKLQHFLSIARQIVCQTRHRDTPTTGGSSNLILGCVVFEGNPTDSELTRMILDRQEDIYGGCTSHANLEKSKANGVKDVCFLKGRGLEEEDICRSRKVYKSLRKFRAGIESGIFGLTRNFGLDKCTWNGIKSFKSYVWAPIISANLLIIARKQLA